MLIVNVVQSSGLTKFYALACCAVLENFLVLNI